MAGDPALDPGNWWDTIKPFVNGAGLPGLITALGLLMVRMKWLGLAGRKQEIEGQAAERVQIAKDNASFRATMQEDAAVMRAAHAAEVARKDAEYAALLKRFEEVSEDRQEGWDRARGMTDKAHDEKHEGDRARQMFNSLLLRSLQLLEALEKLDHPDIKTLVERFAKTLEKTSPFPSAPPVPPLHQIEGKAPHEARYS